MSDWTCASCAGANPEGTGFCGHCGAPAGGAPPAEASTDIADALRTFVSSTVADQLVETGGQLPEERRLVTALFADISGFTPLADRLDPEELLEVIDPVVSALSSIVGRYEGYVEKFAGDALLALFGAPVAHDDDAARALRVALEMHAELARMKEQLPPDAAELTLHVGVNSGHGIARILGSEARMDYAVLGDAVILAQRLESAAPRRETYVSESTVRLTEHRFEFESVGELTLKGKSEPVPAWRLVRERAVEVLPTRAPMVGRGRELGLVRETMAGLANGRGAVLTVTGEPGVGKSRLADEARAVADASGVRWLHARCLSYGAALPYWPFAELLRRNADTRPENEFFAQLLGEGTEGAEYEPEAFRRGLHAAFLSWLDALATAQPTVLALEDAHWIDTASLALLVELVSLSRHAPLLVLVTARPEADETLAALDERRIALRLTPLMESDVLELIEAMLGGPVPRELASFVGRRATGNPFFVQELVRTLQDRGALAAADGCWRMVADWDARELPPTIEALLAGRMDRLPRPAVATLQAAAVIGRRVPAELLVAVGGDPATLDDLVAAAFLQAAEEDGRRVLVFQHALVQDVAYERLLKRQRRDLHRRVADRAETLYGAGDDTIDLLARHRYLGQDPRAVDYLLRAGERARRLYANEEAILHLTRALELEPTRHDVTLDLATLHELVGSHDAALRLYEAVAAATSDVRAWRGIASTLRKQGRYDDALATIDKAFACPNPDDSDVTSLWLEAGWIHSLAGRVAQAIDVLQAGLDAAGAQRTSIVGQILLQIGRAEAVEGELDGALGHVLRAKEIFEENDDLHGLAVSARVLGDTYRLLGRLDEGAAALRRGLELAERVGSVEEIGGCLLNLAAVELALGHVDGAATATRRALEEFERVGHGSGRAQGHANLAWILAQAGSLDEAVGHAEQALEVGRAIGHPLVVADTLDTLATISLERGDFAAAAQHAEDAVALYVDVGALPRAATTLRLAADAWERAGEDERARITRERAHSLVPA